MLQQMQDQSMSVEDSTTSAHIMTASVYGALGPQNGDTGTQGLDT